ncbi:MAG: S9 family peptidase [Euzebya sp.]
MTDPIVAPYGTWPSPLSAADLARSSTHLADLCTDGDTVLWLQSDAAAGGRYEVMSCSPDGEVRAVSPAGFNARTRVHEYGGGALGAGHGVVLACSWQDQRVYRLDGSAPVAVTPEPQTDAGIRWAAMTILPGGQAFVAVRETHGPDRPRDNTNVHGAPEAVNELVLFDLQTGQQTVLVTGPDFIGGPWVNPSGSRIAWLQWDHPDMPWDAAALYSARFDRGTLSDITHLAGGDSAVCGAYWAADDRLLFCDDPSGWWNVYACDLPAGDVTRLQEETVDSGWPTWQHGARRLTSLDDTVYMVTMAEGFSHVRQIGAGRLELQGIGDVMALSCISDRLIAIAGGPQRDTAVVAIDASAGEMTTLSTVPDDPAAAIGALPQPISFPTADGATAHALYYPPTSPTHAGPDGQRPPLVVLSHGGPTGAARTSINATAQYWTSRGLAVVDVNYRGSVGYGREYRDALKHNWGLHDVADCIAAATHLIDRELVDPERLIIEGGSAGGYTTLLALCTTDTFAAGGSLYGVSDVRALATDTHKFESRYMDSMIGAWPEEESVYVERSPITHVHRLRTPMIVLQGDEDKVVPPAQAEMIVDALKKRGITHAYLLFEGEQHGFRKAENITRSLEARLAFYGRVLGFDPADDIALPEFVPGR